MRAARFFIDAPLGTGSPVVLPERVAHHATRVLRLRDGAPIVVFNGSGGEFAATLSVSERRVAAAIDTHHAIERESPLAVTLVQSWIATEKLDWTIEKAVELGVASIVLTPAQRSVVQVTGERAIKRTQRLREVAIAACEQCGRNRVPAIHAFDSLSAALRTALSNAAGVLLLPDAGTSLHATTITDRIALAVGPEGGFDETEKSLALELGYLPRRLGPRVMRTETAGLAALAVLQSTGGDLR